MYFRNLFENRASQVPSKVGIQGNVGITDTARTANKHPADSMLRPSDKGALKNIIDFGRIKQTSLFILPSFLLPL